MFSLSVHHSTFVSNSLSEASVCLIFLCSSLSHGNTSTSQPTWKQSGDFFLQCCIAGDFSMFGLAGSVPVPVGLSLNLARFWFFFLSWGDGRTNRWSKWATVMIAKHEEPSFVAPINRGKGCTDINWPHGPGVSGSSSSPLTLWQSVSGRWGRWSH